MQPYFLLNGEKRMDPDSIPRISYLSYLFVILLIYLASYFAVTETALASVSKNKIKIAADRGDSRASKALYALDNFDRAITTILICTNIVHISAASIVTLQVTRQFGLSWVSLSTIITTILVFFFGEMLPKSIAKKFSETYTLSHADVLVFLMKLLYPISSLLAKIGNFASKMTKSEPELTVTENELHGIIEDMEEEGTLDEDESDLIQAAIDFGDQKVSNIYTKRENIVAININSNNEDILEIIKNNTHSRLPVFSGNIDNIVGILQIRDFLKAYLTDKKFNIRTILTEPLIVGRNYNIDDIMDLMADNQYSIAIIKDNSRTLGLVSVEDILEELVGDIWDEEDAAGGEIQ